MKFEISASGMLTKVIQEDFSEQTVIIPPKVTSIKTGAFINCKNVWHISVEKDNSRYKSIDGVLFDKKDKSLVWYPPRKQQKEYIIPIGVEKINSLAFFKCSFLKKIVFPASLKEICPLAIVDCPLKSVVLPAVLQQFRSGAIDCSALEEVKVDKKNIRYYDIDGVLYDKTKNELVLYPPNRKKPTFFMPAQIKYIGRRTFGSYNRILKQIVLPKGLTVIPDKTFFNCTALEKIEIPSTVTGIGRMAFANCQSLRKISLPESLQWMGDKAFWGCSSLESITMPEGISGIGSEMFYGCKNLRDATIPGSVKKIGEDAFDMEAEGSEKGIKNIPIPHLTIHAPKGSYAEWYAQKRHIRFEPL